MNHAKEIINKDKVKNESQSIYLNASFNHYQSVIDRLGKEGDDTVNLQRSSILNMENKTLPTPKTEEEFKICNDNLLLQQEEYLSNIEKIKVQIANLQNNNNDYNKKKTALTESKYNTSPGKISLSAFVALLTLGLILGAWLNKALFSFEEDNTQNMQI